jgi:uncharacterized protein (DUF4415 family)
MDSEWDEAKRQANILNARVVWPQGKAPVTLRLDRDIIAWFKLHGRGYQTRINAVLRAFVEAQKPRH